MKQRTHLGINAALVGEILSIGDGTSEAALVATEAMAADDRGLVHGSFTFGLADYAAMVAVNDPYVVLGGAACRFLAPVRVGARMVARAQVEGEKGKKRTVAVGVSVEGEVVMEGTFTCFVLEDHVLGG